MQTKYPDRDNVKTEKIRVIAIRVGYYSVHCGVTNTKKSFNGRQLLIRLITFTLA